MPHNVISSLRKGLAVGVHVIRTNELRPPTGCVRLRGGANIRKLCLSVGTPYMTRFKKL